MKANITLLALATTSWAYEGEPELGTVTLIKGREFTVRSDLAEQMIKANHAKKVVDNLPENVSQSNDNEIVETLSTFDYVNATPDELKNFVKANPDLDAVIDLRQDSETVRSIVKAFVDAS